MNKTRVGVERPQLLTLPWGSSMFRLFTGHLQLVLQPQTQASLMAAQLRRRDYAGQPPKICEGKGGGEPFRWRLNV